MKTIVYVDEFGDDIEHFQQYFDPYESEITVIPISPHGKTIEVVVEEIINTECNLVAIDYDLKSSDPSNSFYGDQLLNRINDRKPYLPLLIFTGFEKDVKHKGTLPPQTIIREKRIINDLKNSTFKDEVTYSIEFSITQKKKYREEFSILIEKQSKGDNLTQDEKKRIIELNIINEEMGDRQLTVKSIDEEEFDKINSLIDVTQKLLENLNSDEKNV